MRFEGTLEIAAPREQVFAFLIDPQQVTRCAPGLQSAEVADAEHFKVVLRAGVGPIQATFSFNVEITESRAPEHAALLARGQAPGSAVEMRNTMDLEATGEARTVMSWASDVIVTGMIASMGARLMQGTADKMTQRVFACMKERLETPITALQEQ